MIHQFSPFSTGGLSGSLVGGAGAGSLVSGAVLVSPSLAAGGAVCGKFFSSPPVDDSASASEALPPHELLVGGAIAMAEGSAADARDDIVE